MNIQQSFVPCSNLADLINRLEQDLLIADIRKRDLISAINRLAELLRRPLTAIPINVPTLRAALDGISPVAHRISDKTLQNIRSAVFAAIEIAGDKPVLRSRRRTLNPAWQRLRGALPSKQDAIALSRFALWCDGEGLSPGQVDDAVFARFLAAVEQTGARANTRTHEREVPRVWAALQAKDSTLCLQGLSPHEPRPVPRRRKNKYLIPAAFHEDVRRYARWLQSDDDLDASARPKALKKSTIRTKTEQLVSAADIAIGAGIAPDRFQTVASLVEADVARIIFRTLIARSKEGKSSSASGIAKTLVSMAKEWAHLPSGEVELIRGHAAKVPMPTAMTRKNRAFLAVLSDTAVVDRIFELPLRLFEEAHRDLAKSAEATSPVGQESLFGAALPERVRRDRMGHIDKRLNKVQTAIAIEILLNTGIRLANLFALSWTRNVVWPVGAKRPTLLQFSEEEVKNGQALTFEVPPRLGQMLATYRKTFLPQLVEGNPDAVFARPDGKARSSAGVAVLLKTAIRKGVGIDMSPHQFRHFLANVVLEDQPGNYELVSQILGHVNTKVTLRAYAGLNTQRAGREHARIIDRQREKATTTAPRHRGGSRAKTNPHVPGGKE